jgi:hypothetical protein
MRMLYAVCSWLIVALGLVHMATATRIYHSLTPAAVWFFSTALSLSPGAHA